MLALLLWSCQALPSEEDQSAPLFAVDSALVMDMAVDFDKICLNTDSGNCPDLPATIHYTDEDGSRVQLDVKVRTRGRWRRETGDCGFPALFIYFDPAQVTGTVFDKQTMLPLTTHCQSYSRLYQGYAMLEYLVYRYYNLLTDASLKVRLTETTFNDTGGGERMQRYGFFVEHFQSAASRIGAELVERDSLDPRETDATELAVLSTFQYMIGNLDWSVVKSHNVALFRTAGGTIKAIPYDFDFSGLVNARYATPPDSIHVKSVLDRRYRGFCRLEIRWEDVFARFQAQQGEMLRLLDDLPGVTNQQRREARQFLSRFFATIKSSRKRKWFITDECRPMPPPGEGEPPG